MKDRRGRKRRETGYGGALQSYLRSIGRIAFPTPSGEYRLASEGRRGMESARQTLVETHLRLVVKIAREYGHLGAGIEDLISEGNIGLIEAARRFDPSRGVRFSSYAAWWIRKHMVSALHRHAIQVTSPVPHDPQDEETRDRPGRKAQDSGVPASRSPRKRIVSFEEFTRADDERSWLEAIPSPEPTTPDELILEKQLAKAIRLVLHRLPTQERLILTAHYGLLGAAPRTLQEIGEALGITRERVRQIELRALAHARRILLAKRIGRR